MDRMTELLDASAPRNFEPDSRVSAALSDVVESSTRARRRRLRPGVIVGLSALLLGAGTATAAAAGLLFPPLPPSLLETGDQYDFSCEVTVSADGADFACRGGFVLTPFADGDGFNQSVFNEARLFIQRHDWSSVRPDPALVEPYQMPDGTQASAELISRTMKTQVIDVTQAEFENRGTPLLGFGLRGIDLCQE